MATGLAARATRIVTTSSYQRLIRSRFQTRRPAATSQMAISGTVGLAHGPSPASDHGRPVSRSFNVPFESPMMKLLCS